MKPWRSLGLTMIGAGLMVLPLLGAEKPNPFFAAWHTPGGVPPFGQIEEGHYLPAFRAGIAQQQRQVTAIASNKAAPTFANTVEALDRAGDLLARVNGVFNGLLQADSSPGLQEIARQAAPLLTKQKDDVLLNEALFARVARVYEKRSRLSLTTEQRMLLERTYRNFVRGGAALDADKKKRLREINGELAVLSLQFSDHLLQANNQYRLVLEKPEDLAGLSPDHVAAAAQAAKDAGLAGKWVFTLHSPSIFPFLTLSSRRDLRQQIYTAYVTRCAHGDERDNGKTIQRIVALRLERARLLGYPDHATYTIDDNMAKAPAAVRDFLMKLWTPAREAARREADALQKLMNEEGIPGPLQPWDWWYYAAKVKKARYDFDDEELRPYFSLERVRDGAFMVAKRLYGISFIPRPDLPVYHPEARAFEVRDGGGARLGIYYTDYFPRESKRGGAWMDNFREEYRERGKRTIPIVYNVGNFSRPAGNKPALLSFEEVQTLFHEFGHALHGLLSQCTYRTLSGTKVAIDFVELPSQIMENWAGEPEVLKSFARHYQTGEPIPAALVEKVKRAARFNQGFVTLEYLAASLLDLDWHTFQGEEPPDVEGFERAAMERIGLIPEIAPRYRSSYFNHIFGGEYAAGYYSYIWAEVLDADAFAAFTEKGLFDAQTARAFRKNILEKGGSVDPMEQYRRFRGRDPQVEPLLERRGLMP